MKPVAWRHQKLRRFWGILITTLFLGLGVAACGGDDESVTEKSAGTRSDGEQVGDGFAHRGAQPPGSTPSTDTPLASRPAERCRGAVRVRDPATDRPWPPEPHGRQDTTPPESDLREFELRGGADGLCVRWTTSASVPEGTELVVGIHGPAKRTTGGGTFAYGYGFSVELLEQGPRVTYGLDRPVSDEPRVLRARVGQTERTVSAFVPRAELDRPPSNMPGRPPFPYRGFSFEARVLSPPDRNGRQSVDFWPQQGHQLQIAGYINGRLCVPQCNDPRANPFAR